MPSICLNLVCWGCPYLLLLFLLLKTGGRFVMANFTRLQNVLIFFDFLYVPIFTLLHLGWKQKKETKTSPKRHDWYLSVCCCHLGRRNTWMVISVCPQKRSLVHAVLAYHLIHLRHFALQMLYVIRRTLIRMQASSNTSHPFFILFVLIWLTGEPRTILDDIFLVTSQSQGT